MVKNVYLDTNIFIYLFENTEPFKNNIISFYNLTPASYFTSTFTLGELLVNVYKANRHDLIEIYKRNISNFVKKVVPIDMVIANCYAEIRAAYPAISRPDSLHIAAALSTDCEIFLTNDKKLNNLKIKNLHFPRL